MSQKPDHTGVVIPSLSAVLASLIFSALLVHHAFAHAAGEVETGYRRKKVMLQMVEALAEMLGVGGSIGLSVVIVGVSAVFFVRAIRKYRQLTQGVA